MDNEFVVQCHRKSVKEAFTVEKFVHNPKPTNPIHSRLYSLNQRKCEEISLPANRSSEHRSGPRNRRRDGLTRSRQKERKLHEVDERSLSGLRFSVWVSSFTLVSSYTHTHTHTNKHTRTVCLSHHAVSLNPHTWLGSTKYQGRTTLSHWTLMRQTRGGSRGIRCASPVARKLASFCFQMVHYYFSFAVRFSWVWIGSLWTRSLFPSAGQHCHVFPAHPKISSVLLKNIKK